MAKPGVLCLLRASRQEPPPARSSGVGVATL